MNTAARRLGFEKASDWLIFVAYLGFLFGGIILSNRAPDKYPLLSANDSIYLFGTAPTIMIVGGAVWLLRRRLFGRKVGSGFACLLAAAFAMPAAFLTLGLAIFVNGALDHGAVEKVSAVVLRAVNDSRDRHYVLQLDGKRGPVTFSLRRNEQVIASNGDRVTLDVMPGRLGRPWVRAHVP